MIWFHLWQGNYGDKIDYHPTSFETLEAAEAAIYCQQALVMESDSDYALLFGARQYPIYVYRGSEQVEVLKNDQDWARWMNTGVT